MAEQKRSTGLEQPKMFTKQFNEDWEHTIDERKRGNDALWNAK